MTYNLHNLSGSFSCLLLFILHNIDVRNRYALERTFSFLQHLVNLIRHIALHHNLVKALCILCHRRPSRKAPSELLGRLFEIDAKCLETVNSSDMLALRTLDPLDRYL